MSNRLKFVTTIFFLLFLIFMGWRLYAYFFDTSCPQITLIGIEDGNYYHQDVACKLIGNHGYKISDISIYLDDKPLVNQFKINKSTFEHQFTIPTIPLSAGKHILKVEASSASYIPTKTAEAKQFFVDNEPLHAAFVRPESELKVFQGRTLHIQFQVSKNIKQAVAHILSNTFECFPESKNSHIYEAFIPISCEENPNEYLCTVEIIDNVGNKIRLDSKFQVILFPFKKQNLKLDPERIKAEKEMGVNNEQLEQELLELVKHSPKEKLWHGSFLSPIEIQAVSTDYGTIRVTQEKGRYVHRAVDVLNTPKSVVWAPQDGIVIIKNRYGYSGNTVVIDHGYGVFSLFFHLDDFADIKLNAPVKRGNPLGTLGKTGYATGYHLHWEMRINNIPVDPLQWIKPNF